MKEKWLKTTVSSWLKISRVISDVYSIDFSKSYDIDFVRKLATALYLLPEISAKIEAKSVNDLISKIAKEYKGQYQLFKKFFTTTNLENEDLFKFLMKISDSLVGRPDLDQIKSKLASKEVRKVVNKHLREGTLNTVEDFLAIVNPESKAEEVTKEEKPEVDFVLKDTKYIDGNRYDLYLALTPKGIKQLANSGFNTWCVNSWNYARSYYTSSRNMGKQFWFIFKNGAPLFAIGGSDGISDLMDDSLSELSKPILESDYKALQEWQKVYNYPLEEQKIVSKEEFERIVNKLVDDINSGKVPSSSDWSIILTYSDFFRDKIDLNKLLESVLKMNYSVQRADGEKIDKAEFLVYIAKFLNRDSFENNPNIDPNILAEVQKKIGSDFDASVDYLTTVVKGYKPDKYGVYMEGLIESIDPEEFDEDDAEDLSKIIDLRIRSNAPLTDEEKKHIKEVLSYGSNIRHTFGYPNIYEVVGIDIMSIAIKNPVSSYYFAIEQLKSGKEIPNKIIQRISEDPKYSYKFAKELLEYGRDIPNEIIRSMLEGSEDFEDFDEDADSDYYLYDIATDLLRLGKDVPNELMQRILRRLDYSYEFAVELLKLGKDIPNEIIQSISGSSEYSYKFAVELLRLGKDVPSEIIQGISKRPWDSRYFAERLLEHGKEIPNEIIQSISKNSELSYEFARSLLRSNKNIPNELIQGASKNSLYSHLLARELLESNEDIPNELIQSISKDLGNSYYFAKELLEHGREIPNELIQSVSKSLKYSYELVETLFKSGKDIPDELVQSISKSPYYYGLFLAMTGKEIPKEIIQSVSKSPEDSYYFAKRLLKFGREIPNELIQSISENSELSREFAEELLKLGKDIKDIPKEIIQSVSENFYESRKFADKLIRLDKDMPNEITRSISRYPESAYEFATELLKYGKDIPNELIQSMLKEPYYSYQFATELVRYGKEIPTEIIQSVAKEPMYSYGFSGLLDFDKSKIPPEIQESAKKYVQYKGEFEKQSSLSIRSKWLI